MAKPSAVTTLGDRALLDRLAFVIQQHREQTRLLLELIDVIDRRKLWAKQGHPSLFAFCVERFHMSESTAAKRIGAARAARRFPVILDMVARGELHLSGIHRLKAHLTDDNHRELLHRAKHRTIRQVERLVREIMPLPDVPTTLRKLPERQTCAASIPSVVLGPNTTADNQRAPATAAATTPAPFQAEQPTRQPRPPERPQRAPDPQPLSPARYKLQVTLDEDARQTLRQLQDLLAHQVPNGDPAAIVKRALETLLATTLRRKAALTERPRGATPPDASVKTTSRNRAIPAPIRRDVWQRDQGRCGFVGSDGKRCNATRGLEFAHAMPWGKGGGHSAENLSLRCKAHNALEAERDYGERFMRNKRQQRPTPGGPQTGPFKVKEPRALYAANCTTASRTLGGGHVATWATGMP